MKQDIKEIYKVIREERGCTGDEPCEACEGIALAIYDYIDKNYVWKDKIPKPVYITNYADRVGVFAPHCTCDEPNNYCGEYPACMTCHKPIKSKIEKFKLKDLITIHSFYDKINELVEAINAMSRV